MPQLIEVSAGILTRDGRVLACQRNVDQRHAGKWEFPGGKREPGESIEECLRRELREELGIDPELGELVWRTEYSYPERDRIALMFFTVPRYRGRLENREFADIRWVEVARLAELDFLDADRELIELLVRGEIALA